MHTHKLVNIYLHDFKFFLVIRECRSEKSTTPASVENSWSYFVTCDYFFFYFYCCFGCSTGSGLTEQAALGIGGLVSKGTVVLRRWGSETQNFGFIN